MRPNDPRVVATYNRIASNLESANITTQSYLYSASQRVEPYVTSCLGSLSLCIEASCQPCFNVRDDYYRRKGHHPSRTTAGRRGRDYLGFDFYDDWEQEETEWGNDELERLLSGVEDDGGVAAGAQPGRHPKMSYGSRLGGRVVGKRKGGTVSGKDGLDDPNVVPQSSMFGFLERLPWKIGGRGSGRYRPSVAGLEEGIGRRGTFESEPALSGGDGDPSSGARKGGGRGRSGSKSSTNSLSSRGDLFPSDDEDAVPLDDEFAMALERRPTNTTSDDRSSSRKAAGMGIGRRSTGSIKTTSSRSRDTRTSRKTKSERDPSAASSGDHIDEVAEQIPAANDDGDDDDDEVEIDIEDGVPTMTDLKLEEDRVTKEEESLVEERRQAARKLAAERGLPVTEEEEEEEEDGEEGGHEVSVYPQVYPLLSLSQEQRIENDIHTDGKQHKNNQHDQDIKAASSPPLPPPPPPPPPPPAALKTMQQDTTTITTAPPAQKSESKEEQ